MKPNRPEFPAVPPPAAPGEREVCGDLDIRIDRDLLTVDGVPRSPSEVYRKVMPRRDAEAEAMMEGMGE